MEKCRKRERIPGIFCLEPQKWGWKSFSQLFQAWSILGGHWHCCSPSQYLNFPGIFYPWECLEEPGNAVGHFPAPNPKFPPPFFWDSLKNWSIWGFFLALKGFLGSKSHKNLRNVGFGAPGTERNSWTLVGIWSAGISWERSGKKRGKMGSGNI